MTEAEWFTCVGREAQAVFDFLYANASRRKLLLFTVAERRSHLSFSEDGSWRRFMENPRLRQVMDESLDALERYADGNLDEEDREKAYASRCPFMTDMTDVEMCDFQDWFDPLTDWIKAKYGTVWGCVYGSLAVRQEIFGNPFRPVMVETAWLVPNVRHLAHSIYEAREFQSLPNLADALVQVGCSNDAILSHCRRGGPHVRGCWVLDLILGRS